MRFINPEAYEIFHLVAPKEAGLSPSTGYIRPWNIISFRLAVKSCAFG